MKNSQNFLDTSEELQIFRYQNGVKFVRPDRIQQERRSLLSFDTGCKVKNLLQSSFNVYFTNTESVNQNTNEHNAETLGADSVMNAIGKSAFDFAPKAAAQVVVENDKDVMRKNAVKILNEEVTWDNGTHITALSVKSPWYNQENQIIGVIGCSIILGKQNLALSLAQIVQFGLLRTQQYSRIENHFLSEPTSHHTQLSKRETEILNYLIKGKTARGIAEILNLSQRTVEHHLINIKTKMGVSSKAELIEKIMNYL